MFPMQQRPFQQVDVFTATPYLGNPLAVVLDGKGLATEQMQAFTDWTNLSEATFVLPPAHPQADYKLRIFCPGRELPFAGHPTLGSCHAWLRAGGRPKADVIVQECGIGLVKIRQDAATHKLAFAAPPLLRSGPLDEADVALIARGLNIPRSDILAHAWCDNGPKWRGVMLASADAVRALQPDGHILSGLDIGVVGPARKVGVVAPQPAESVGGAGGTEPTDFEVRAFFHTATGMREDPVTGSLNAGLAQWLINAGLAPKRYVAAQGTCVGRAGRVHVEQLGTDIWIGGVSVTCVEGTVRL
jgi:PhzF family phenazine biosynthesis protein